jgi:hypothetical protein
MSFILALALVASLVHMVSSEIENVPSLPSSDIGGNPIEKDIQYLIPQNNGNDQNTNFRSIEESDFKEPDGSMGTIRTETLRSENVQYFRSLPPLQSIPNDTTGGTMKPSDPNDTTGGTMKPSDPNDTTGGTMKPSDPNDTTGGTMKPSDPNDTTGGKMKPSDPNDTTGGKMKPSDPNDTTGGKMKPSDPNDTTSIQVDPGTNVNFKSTEERNFKNPDGSTTTVIKTTLKYVTTRYLRGKK